GRPRAVQRWHEHDGSWHAWVFWVWSTGDTHHGQLVVRAGHENDLISGIATLPPGRELRRARLAGRRRPCGRPGPGVVVDRAVPGGQVVPQHGVTRPPRNRILARHSVFGSPGSAPHPPCVNGARRDHVRRGQDVPSSYQEPELTDRRGWVAAPGT